MNKCTGHSRAGLSLIEVLIAISVLAIAVLSLAQLQSVALRHTATAEAMNRTTRLVRGELEWQRQTALEPASLECSAFVPDDFVGCAVEVLPCVLEFEDDGTSTFTCNDAVSPSTYRVTVTAQGPRGQELTLTTLWTGLFIAGGAGSSVDD